jgi:hypothetical protein
VRFNFVVAAYLWGRFMNRPHSLDYAHLASGAFYKAIILLIFYEIINIG